MQQAGHHQYLLCEGYDDHTRSELLHVRKIVGTRAERYVIAYGEVFCDPRRRQAGQCFAARDMGLKRQFQRRHAVQLNAIVLDFGDKSSCLCSIRKSAALTHRGDKVTECRAEKTEGGCPRASARGFLRFLKFRASQSVLASLSSKVAFIFRHQLGGDYHHGAQAIVKYG